MNPPSQFAASFLTEAEDLLRQVEEIILEIEQRQEAENLNRLFRVFHTIKGSGAMFGFDEVASFTHHIETVLDKVRDGTLQVTGELINLILASKDHIQELLSVYAGGQPPEAGAGGQIVLGLQSLLLTGTAVAPAAGVSPTPNPTPPPNSPALDGAGQVFRIHFRPAPRIMATGLDPISLLQELRALGSCSVTLDTSQVPPLDQLQPDQCYLAWEIILATERDLNAIKDVFIFVEDESDLRIEPQGGAVLPTRAPLVSPIEVPAPARASTPPASPPHADKAIQDVEEKAVALSPESTHSPSGPGPAVTASAATESGPGTGPAARKSALAKEATIRVASDRLDRLVGLVGELVINQSRLVQASSKANLPELSAPVEEIERLVAEIRDNVLGIRMMPIGTTFARFRRLVRDLSLELGKEIQLICEGDDTELDKTVIDQISDPLMHLLRNSLDHGIQRPEERLQAGKPRVGTIRLTAAHEGAQVQITIQDDGRGLDPEAIRAKAIEKKLIAPDAVLSDSDLCNLIFLPGFSTAKAVTSVSGRGVGMDVVRREIELLRGKVEISSQPGQGTRVTLTLPLTLAIIEGLLVELGPDCFIIPMSLVAENVELPRADRSRNNGRNVIAVRGELVPYLRLRELFDSASPELEIEKVVIVNHAGHRLGLVVDRVIGSHQTVIQSLGRFYRHVEIVSGATIMGDGRVALILDVARLVGFHQRAADPHRARGAGMRPAGRSFCPPAASAPALSQKSDVKAESRPSALVAT